MLAAQKMYRPDGSAVVYPESDGQPMADNTVQFDWMVRLQGELDAQLKEHFVAGNLIWYPVEGDPTIRVAPDVMVVLGRPKGHRGSYRQWEEGGVAPQVVFEIWSPGNTLPEAFRKLNFYDRYGVQEYYLFDPDRVTLSGWIRSEGRLREIPEMNGWESPLLGIRFELTEEDLYVYHPDGTRFVSFRELAAERDRERQRAEAERQRADEATQRADEAIRRADEAIRRAEALAARLRALGGDPDNL